MNTQLLTLTKTLLTMGAFISAMTTAYGYEDEKPVLTLPKCQYTRLGCLDKNGPIVPIDQPVFIQVGLEINIKCQAKTLDGSSYILNFQMNKKAELDPKIQSHGLNYYLTPGEYKGFTFYGIAVSNEVEIPAAIGGYYPNATISESQVENQLVISAYEANNTRGGHVETESKIVIPTLTSKSKPLQILSMAKKTTKTKFVDGKFVPATTESTVTFAETNCVYF